MGLFNRRRRQAQPSAPPRARRPQAAASGNGNQAIQAQMRQREEAGDGQLLYSGSRGSAVRELQSLLGMADIDGVFGRGTRTQVLAFQRQNGLPADGVVGPNTWEALRGQGRGRSAPATQTTSTQTTSTQTTSTQTTSTRTTQPSDVRYQKSPHHDDSKFVPAYPMMAYHESGSYRTRQDPYAVGTITNPSRNDDLGGKTYGVYQFESRVHSGGNRRTSAAKGSTVSRFARWDKNPYGPQLQKVIDQHGVTSPQFDALWKKLATAENAAFGKAQQDFLKHDKGAKAVAWMKRAGLSNQVQGDDAFFDLVLGTLNHVGTLANPAADHLAALAKQKGRALTVKEAATALTDYKSGRVESWFRSSPNAHRGIRNRFKAEKAAFQ